MLKRTINYEDFNGNPQSEIFYFNLSKPELVELEMNHEGGFGAFMQRIIDAKDPKVLIQEFKKIVLLAYGQKSDDGKRFDKSDQMTHEFTQTAAYNALFMELATDDKAAAAFIEGIMPNDLLAAVQNDKKNLLPPPPPAGRSDAGIA